MISSAQTSVIITIHNQLYNGSLKGGGCPSRNLTNQVSVIGNRVSELINGIKSAYPQVMWSGAWMRRCIHIYNGGIGALVLFSVSHYDYNSNMIVVIVASKFWVSGYLSFICYRGHECLGYDEVWRCIILD